MIDSKYNNELVSIITSNPVISGLVTKSWLPSDNNLVTYK